jgi:hypothetical protein
MFLLGGTIRLLSCHRAPLAAGHRRAASNFQLLKRIRCTVRVDPAVAADHRAGWNARPLAGDRDTGVDVVDFARCLAGLGISL